MWKALPKGSSSRKETCTIDALALLQKLGRGQLLEDLREAVASTAEEVVATGNPGKVTLTLTISTRAQGDAQVEVNESIGRSMPKKKSKGALLFALDGDLYREDPRQLPITFRTVDGETRDIRDVSDEQVQREVRA